MCAPVVPSAIVGVTYADLSRHNGTVDWAAYPLSGVLLKVGGSDDGQYVDAAYAVEALNARARGKHLGHYWFNGTGGATADAKFFLANLAHYQSEDLLILDTEGEGNLPAWSPSKALTWFKTVRTAKPKARLVIYMSEALENEQDWSALVDFGVQLWVAFYGDKANGTIPSRQPHLRNWKTWLLWQYTSTATVPGLSSHVDLSTAATDVFPAATPAPPAPPTPKEEPVDTVGSFQYSPKGGFTLSMTQWREVPFNDQAGYSFVSNFVGVVHTDVAFAITGLPFGSTVQARFEVITYLNGKAVSTTFTNVVELQGSGGTAFPSFGDTVTLTADQRLRLVLLAQAPGAVVTRISASVLRFPKG